MIISRLPDPVVGDPLPRVSDLVRKINELVEAVNALQHQAEQPHDHPHGHDSLNRY